MFAVVNFQLYHKFG